MADESKTIENPVSGERFSFRKTAAETGGELLQLELVLRPGGRVPVDHVHTLQEERFEVLSGRARFRLGKTLQELSQGESLVVPPGIAHGLRNETDDEARVLVEFRPARDMERFFEIYCGLACDGRVDKRGVPNFLRSAVIARELQAETYLAGLPIGLQKAGMVLLAPIGRLLGYRVGDSQ